VVGEVLSDLNSRSTELSPAQSTKTTQKSIQNKGNRGDRGKIEKKLQKYQRKEKQLKTKAYPKSETCNEWQFLRKKMEEKQQMNIN